MLIKHLSGSKANQVEEFSLKYHNELVFGRDVSATVKYDPDRDDLVGREHAKISRNPNDPADPNGFVLTDLNSRNGTFLNRERINGTVKLNIGDSVQFGPGGPEFTFDVEPRPENYSKTTRVVDSARTATPATRTVGTEAMAATAGAGKPAGTVGKATVERMISETVTETKKSQGKKFGIIGAVAGVLILFLFGAVLIGGYLFYSSRESAIKEELGGKTSDIERKIESDKANAPKAAADIAERFTNSVVKIEVAWRLIHSQRKAQVYHQFIDSNIAARIATALKQPFNTNARAVPVYVQVGDSYEPVLVESGGGVSPNQPIGSVHSGTGFIVTSDGFILTNRHVAATWKTGYLFPDDTPRGILLSSDFNQILAFDAPPPPNWVPANSRSAGGNLGKLMNVKVASPLDYVGVNDQLEVALPGKDRRMNAQLVESSDRHDVALMKIDKPGELTKVELFDNYDELKKGEEVVMMGYPGVTAAQYGVVASQDMFNQKTQLKTIPNPTVTVTSVSNILRSNTKDLENQVISEIGDVIQLSTGSTGPGNSGGPVFDMQGRVIGIYFAFRRGADLQYAVPIRYGKQLME